MTFSVTTYTAKTAWGITTHDLRVETVFLLHLCHGLCVSTYCIGVCRQQRLGVFMPFDAKELTWSTSRVVLRRTKSPVF